MMISDNIAFLFASIIGLIQRTSQHFSVLHKNKLFLVMNILISMLPRDHYSTALK